MEALIGQVVNKMPYSVGHVSIRPPRKVLSLTKYLCICLLLYAFPFLQYF